MVVREKNCYYAIALTDFFVFLSCAELSVNASSRKFAMPCSDETDIQDIERYDSKCNHGTASGCLAGWCALGFD